MRQKTPEITDGIEDDKSIKATNENIEESFVNSPEQEQKLEDRGEANDKKDERLSPNTSTDESSLESSGKKGKNQRSKKLPKCSYGKSCYRKNPDHLKEYSHSDHESSDDDNEKPECPYGTSCYRQNLEHKAEYKHTQPPAAAKQKRRRTSTRPKRKSVLAGASDDDGENTYDYDDSFLDDDDDETGFESESSYNDDEEDSDFTLEDEDLNELRK